MKEYDDFALLGPENFETVAKEYQKKVLSKTLSVNSLRDGEDVETIGQKIEYLLKLVDKLKLHTNNQDAITVLNQLQKDIIVQQTKLSALIKNGITAQNENDAQTVLFCNNLKLAVQTSSEIIKLLIQIKDDEETSGEAKLELTEIINSFIDINNKFVSLFGECRYRQFSLIRR